MPQRIQLGLLAAAALTLAQPADAARHDPPEREMLEGHPMITLLDWGDIPSIDDPVFVPTSVADAFMMDQEQVIGITDPDGGNPRCYSLLHLDHHEVVNDEVGETPIAVTW
jgi:hypothetical protein